MTAQISKVHPPKVNAKGDIYYKIEMITKPFNTYGFTYIMPDNHNFENWQGVIEHQGCWVKNLSWYDEEKNIIDADSKIIFQSKKLQQEQSQLNLF